MMPSYGSSPATRISPPVDFRRALPLSKMITHRLSLADTGLGFRLTAEAKESLKVIIEPHRQ